MKINRLETHDRYQHFTGQDFDIGACCQDLINKRPFGEFPFYIFAHARTIGMDEKFKLFTSGVYASWAEVPEKTIIWQPRLTKPKAQTNSMLFKGYPGTDLVRVIWIIPDRALWPTFEKGKITENKTITESIDKFEFAREELERKEDDDLPDHVIDSVYRELSKDASKHKLMDKLYL